MKILIDKREKKPYTFFNKYECEFKTLKTGDYSLENLESFVIIERKTKNDAYLSLGKNRKRFENEFRRLSCVQFPFLIIESDLRHFLKKPKYSKMSPSACINTLISWSIKYEVPFYFTSNRKLGEVFTLRVLEKFYKYYNEFIKQNNL